MTSAEISVTEPAAAQAFVLPPHRRHEAREIATEAKWFDGCPEAGCRRRKRCAGKLRRIGDGPRCYPGCLAFALATLADPAPTEEARATLRRLIAPKGFFEVGRKDMPTPPEALLTLLLGLARGE